jgi:hypothetical protein
MACSFGLLVPEEIVMSPENDDASTICPAL